jgi:hypothetical protein
VPAGAPQAEEKHESHPECARRGTDDRSDVASHAKLPPPPPKSDAEKAPRPTKRPPAKAKDAADLAKAQDKAVANYKKNAASMDRKK